MFIVRAVKFNNNRWDFGKNNTVIDMSKIQVDKFETAKRIQKEILKNCYWDARIFNAETGLVYSDFETPVILY